MRYPFLVRLFLLFPVMIIMGIFWGIIGVFSVRSLGKVLVETGNNLLKP
jgi:hypothetical protein